MAKREKRDKYWKKKDRENKPEIEVFQTNFHLMRI
jgi:hypothetical protein